MTGSDKGSATIAVVGGGLIGISWSALFTAHGFDARLYEPNVAARETIKKRVSSLQTQVVELQPGLPCSGSLLLTESLDAAVADAFWVQENAPENIPLKRDLYGEIEASAPAGITIASSTSSLIWSDLSAEMQDPSRLITAHPFNPPHLMPLVELFGSDAARLDAASSFYRSVGRHPVRMKREAVGHIANRLSSALWREAVNMVAEGIADVSDIDDALVYGPGLRWSVIGSHMAYHLGGGPGGISHYLAHLGPSQERRWQDLGSPRLDAVTQEKLIAGIDAEANGRKITELEELRDQALIAVQRMLQGKRL